LKKGPESSSKTKPCYQYTGIHAVTGTQYSTVWTPNRCRDG